MPITIESSGLRLSDGSPVTPGAARQPAGASSGHRLSTVVIGLAVAGRIMRNPRTYETAIVVVIGVAAVAGLGKASRTNSLARVAAWDKRRREAEMRRLESEMRRLKHRKPGS